MKKQLHDYAFACVLGLSALPGSANEPVRQITHGPKFHWFGYYDKLQIDPTNRYVLGMAVDFEGRSPKAGDAIEVGMVDLRDRDKWIRLGQSRSWCWQQGCMLQWIPQSTSKVLWNDRENGKFVSRILDVKTRELRTIPTPIYALSPDGRTAVTLDFERVQDMRPGYGYPGLPDTNRADPAPANAGIYAVDLDKGRRQLIVALADIVKIPPITEGKTPAFDVSKHYVNHLLFAPDGKRFIFLHRWRPLKGGGFSTRMCTADIDGSDVRVVDPYGKTSHFIWRDSSHILAWSWHPSKQWKFYLYHDGNGTVEAVGAGIMKRNGHCSYLKNTDWILNDAYPDSRRDQLVYLYHVPTRKRIELGRFHSPPKYTGQWRCDTHPRANVDGNIVCIDSPHHGGRQLYLIPVGNITATRHEP